MIAAALARVAGLAALAGLAASVGLAALVGLAAGCSSHPPTRPLASTYGGLPAFLPTSSLRPDSVLTGTSGHPALTVEGDSVAVNIVDSPPTQVLITVVGPVVPGQGLPRQTPATTCTWTVTLTHPGAPVPIRVADFSAVDHLGMTYHPALVPGEPRPPNVLVAGRSVSFELRAVMPTGEGLMRWAPDGQHIVASWDFAVEND